MNDFGNEKKSFGQQRSRPKSYLNTLSQIPSLKVSVEDVINSSASDAYIYWSDKSSPTAVKLGKALFGDKPAKSIRIALDEVELAHVVESKPENFQRVPLPGSHEPVSYTHLTLPTKRIV